MFCGTVVEEAINKQEIRGSSSTPRVLPTDVMKNNVKFNAKYVRSTVNATQIVYDLR